MGATVTRCKYYGGPSHDGLPVMYVGGLISFASTVIFLFTLDISG